jgi:hypothetical protein
LFSVLTLSEVAIADVTPEDRAAAEVLFREAKALAEGGNFPEACGKFGESQRLDPQIGTLLYLATCHEQQGKTATAWIEFTDARTQAEAAGKADRIAQATEGVERLEKVLSKIKVKVESPVAGLNVRVNGREMRMYDTALPYDPGEVVVEATAPDKKPFRTTMTLPPGPTEMEIVVPTLEPEAASLRPKPIVPPKVTEEDPGADQRTVGFIVGGAGIGVAILGAVFGGLAAAESSSADEDCEGRFCTTEGLDGHDRANAFAWVSNIGIGVGVAAIAAGTIIVLTAPSAPDAPATALKASAFVRPEGGLGLNVGGSW